jgi:hypothetical protein
MELEQLKAAWASQAQRIDQLEASALQAWREPRLRDIRRRLRWFSGMQLAWLLVWIAVTAMAASFWIEYRQVPQLLLTGLAFHLYGIAAIWVSITRALLAMRIERSDAPVLLQLQRIAQLRRFTALGELALGLPWFCLWLLATQWLCVRWLGLDLYAAAPVWFVATLGFGMVAMLGSGVLARWALRRLPVTHGLRRWLEGLSGQSLAHAQRQLRELQEDAR